MNTRENWLKASTVPALLIAAAVLSFYLPIDRPPKDPLQATAVHLMTLEVDNSQDLAAFFTERGYLWPPDGQVPPVAIRSLPPDLNEIDVKLRKALFFQSVLPLVLAENQQLKGLRQRVTQLDAAIRNDQSIKDVDRTLMAQLFERYRIEGELDDAEARSQLLRRLDVVPVSLALAQAAKESGWGTSRFTREANNLFGEWTWDEEAGELPGNRVPGANHFVRRFPDLQSAVRSYIWNLNVGHAYSDFRRERERQRLAGQEPDGLELARTLTRYSERGEIYTHEIRSMIRFDTLDALDAPGKLELSKAD